MIESPDKTSDRDNICFTVEKNFNFALNEKTFYNFINIQEDESKRNTPNTANEWGLILPKSKNIDIFLFTEETYFKELICLGAMGTSTLESIL